MTIKTELIEAMAQAISVSNGDRYSDFETLDGGHVYDYAKPSAVAALTAMLSILTSHGIKLTAREPTDEMVKASMGLLYYLGDEPDSAGMLARVWLGQHDAAPDLLGEMKKSGG